MNYYEHHLGDYMRDTAHLSMVEDAAYRRLLDAYYVREKALPPSMRECCKLARAATKPERDAVAYVLGEFFELREDGHHQTRADAEIAHYLESEPDREARRDNDRERQRRSRERRRSLFEQLRAAGLVPSFDAKTGELEALLSRVTNETCLLERPQLVTRDNTATQSPVPREEKEIRKEYLPPPLAGKPEDKPLSARDRVWALGVPLLGEGARGLLGKLAKAHGEEALVGVLAEATLERPIEPKAWVIAACEAKGKAKRVNGHHEGGFGPGRSNMQADHDREPRPAWVVQAGFENIWEAENVGCYEHTAHQFREGRRVVTA